MAVDLRSLKSRTVAGAIAGNITVTGIKTSDKLISVQPVNVASADLGGEFKITADNTINNAGGSSTATMIVLVTWIAGNVRGAAVR